MFFNSIGMCFENIQMHSESILMYFDRMQMYSEITPLHFANIHVCFVSMQMLFKTIRMQFEEIYECIWNVCDYRNISSYHVKEKHKSVVAFHRNKHFHIIFR